MVQELSSAKPVELQSLDLSAGAARYYVARGLKLRAQLVEWLDASSLDWRFHFKALQSMSEDPKSWRDIFTVKTNECEISLSLLRVEVFGHIRPEEHWTITYQGSTYDLDANDLEAHFDLLFDPLTAHLESSIMRDLLKFVQSESWKYVWTARRLEEAAPEPAIKYGREDNDVAPLVANGPGLPTGLTYADGRAVEKQLRIALGRPPTVLTRSLVAGLIAFAVLLLSTFITSSPLFVLPMALLAPAILGVGLYWGDYRADEDTPRLWAAWAWGPGETDRLNYGAKRSRRAFSRY